MAVEDAFTSNVLLGAVVMYVLIQNANSDDDESEETRSARRA